MFPKSFASKTNTRKIPAGIRNRISETKLSENGISIRFGITSMVFKTFQLDRTLRTLLKTSLVDSQWPGQVIS